jgi:hypothetical protein
LPSGLNAIEEIGAEAGEKAPVEGAASSVIRRLPGTFHSEMLPSGLPAARVSPSGLNASVSGLSEVGSLSGSKRCMPAASHRLVLCPEVTTSVWPFGLYAIAPPPATQSASFRVAVFHT